MAKMDYANVVRAVYDAFNAGDLDRLASYAAPDARVVNVAFETTAGFRDDWELWAKAFPDGKVEINNIVAAEDHVVAEIVGRGTHTGPLPAPEGEIRPTGRRVEVRIVDVYRFHEGKIVEVRTYFDAFSLFRQLGIGAPPPGVEARGGAGAPERRH